MSVDKIKISSLWAFLLAGVSSHSYAAFPDVGSMLNAFEPVAAAQAPELNAVIIAIDALPTEQQRFDALLTLAPSADGSLRAASEGPMRQMESVLYQRLERVRKNHHTGVASGDELKTNAKANVAKARENFAKTDPKAKKVKATAVKTNGTSADPEVATTTTTDTTAVAATPATDTTVITTTESTPTTTTEVTTDEPVITVEEPTLETDKGVWLQIVGNNTGQDERFLVPGYDADVAGLLIGRDHLFSENLMVGAAIGYVHADVDSRGPSGSWLDIKRFQGTIYGGLNFDDPFFINMAFTVAYNDYNNDRYILIPPVGGVPFVNIAWSDFGAWEVNAHIEGGYEWQCGHFRAIPKMMLNFSQFNINGYVEEDAFGLDLYVKYEDMTFIPLGIGIKIEYENEFEHALVIPEMHVYGFHDFKHNSQIAKALFTAGGYDFLSQGAEPARDSFEIGAGIAVHSDVNTAIIIQYDYAGRTDYHRNSAFIKIRHEWA